MDIVFTILSLVGFIALTAGTALFVAAEFSLTALERSTVDEAARGGDRRSRQVQHAHKTLRSSSPALSWASRSQP